jgi:hypothetical protein
MSKEDQIERAKFLLTNRDFVLYVGACGCCGSPSVYLELEGEPIIFDPAQKDAKEVFMRAVDNCSIDTSTFSIT